ncbi:DUF2514 family protein [Burkholderia lata]|uniref:DUF2514 family protein n=1 Tax=Burkholderia lata (strain ATCC 17760 / DSM 23089 / LMG 22485 / NCIMB 9086 / R18194 / 383) TaxID=482957 RepID=UPI0020C602FE|nr:DUF2514 family protein [Burkholderia lata]
MLTYQSRDRIRLEAACRGSRIVRAAVDAIPEDMTRKGIEMSGLDPIGVLADVLGSIDDRAGELAKIADERGVAGQQGWARPWRVDRVHALTLKFPGALHYPGVLHLFRQ